MVMGWQELCCGESKMGLWVITASLPDFPMQSPGLPTYAALTPRYSNTIGAAIKG